MFLFQFVFCMIISLSMATWCKMWTWIIIAVPVTNYNITSRLLLQLNASAFSLNSIFKLYGTRIWFHCCALTINAVKVGCSNKNTVRLLLCYSQAHFLFNWLFFYVNSCSSCSLRRNVYVVHCFLNTSTVIL